MLGFYNVGHIKGVAALRWFSSLGSQMYGTQIEWLLGLFLTEKGNLALDFQYSGNGKKNLKNCQCTTWIHHAWR